MLKMNLDFQIAVFFIAKFGLVKVIYQDILNLFPSCISQGIQHIIIIYGDTNSLMNAIFLPNSY
jgi:hypothetical protein